MFRDRTNLFLSYRRTVPRSSRARAIDLNEEENLIGNRRYRDTLTDATGNTMEMKPMVQLMFDIAGELDNNLAFIKSQINELNGYYKKLVIANQQDKAKTEELIEELNYRILKDFEKCYVLIKKFEYLEKHWQQLGLNYSGQDVEILINFKKNYARRVQENLMTFRNLQNNYMKFLNDNDDDQTLLLMEEEATKPMTGDTIEEYSKQVLQTKKDLSYLQQRDRDISKLAMGILEISTIFKEMEELVVDQGTMLDRIDYNLQNTVADLQQSDRELIKAKHYQKRTTKCKLIFLLLLIVFVLLMIVIVRPHSSTKVVEVPTKGDGGKSGEQEVDQLPLDSQGDSPVNDSDGDAASPPPEDVERPQIENLL